MRRRSQGEPGWIWKYYRCASENLWNALMACTALPFVTSWQSAPLSNINSAFRHCITRSGRIPLANSYASAKSLLEQKNVHNTLVRSESWPNLETQNQTATIYLYNSAQFSFMSDDSLPPRLNMCSNIISVRPCIVIFLHIVIFSRTASFYNFTDNGHNSKNHIDRRKYTQKMKSDLSK